MGAELWKCPATGYQVAPIQEQQQGQTILVAAFFLTRRALT
jgi:hypothetical protein